MIAQEAATNFCRTGESVTMMMTLNRKRWLFWTLLACTLSAGMIGCSALDVRQRQLIFNPTVSRWDHAADLQDVWIPFTSELTQEPVKLHALWLGDRPSQLDSKQAVLLYLHGARWDVWASRSRIERLHQLGFSVLAIDYRGFGKTTTGRSEDGKPHNTLPSESMAYEDAQAAWSWLGRQFPRQKRYIYGHSLGGAVAIDLASKVGDEAGTLVEGTFSSARDVLATTHWGWLPIGPLLTQRFESIDKVRRIGSPLLVVHGSDDDVIKPELGERLFAAAANPKQFLLVPGGDHHNASSLGLAQYQQALHTLFGMPEPAAPAVLAQQPAPAAAGPTVAAGVAAVARLTAGPGSADQAARKSALRPTAMSRTNAPHARSAATDNS
jgi:alpha-beta hydrolase superfamily lysophospholipase